MSQFDDFVLLLLTIKQFWPPMNSADITRPPDEAVEKVFYFVLTFIMRFCIIIKHIWARSSAGRAFGSHPRGRGFDPLRVHQFAASFCTMRRFLCLKNFGRPCRAPNPEVGCEPGGVINVLFENPSVSRFFLCILQSSAGNRIAFMPPSRKFLQKFPHHRRLTQPWAAPLDWSWRSA